MLASDYAVDHATLTRFFARPEIKQQLRQTVQELRAERRPRRHPLCRTVTGPTALVERSGGAQGPPQEEATEDIDLLVRDWQQLVSVQRKLERHYQRSYRRRLSHGFGDSMPRA